MNEHKNELVEIEFDRLVAQTPKAIIVEVETDEYAVGKSQIDNLTDLEEDLKRPVYRRTETHIVVPRWLAESNGWEED